MCLPAGFPKITLNDLRPESQNQDYILQSLLKGTFPRKCFLNLTGSSNATKSRLFKGEYIQKHALFWDAIKVFSPETGEPLTATRTNHRFGELSVWCDLQRKWSTVLDNSTKPKLSEDALEAFAAKIEDLLKSSENGVDDVVLKNVPEISGLRKSLLNMELADCLASLTLIALTWPLWRSDWKGKDMNRIAAVKALLPYLYPPATEEAPADARPYSDDPKYLANARTSINAGDWETAATQAICAAALENTSFQYKKDAYQLLVDLSEHEPVIPLLQKAFYSIDDLLKEARDNYGIDVSAHMSSIQKKQVSSSSKTSGTCILNAENDCTRQLIATLPQGWTACICSNPLAKLEEDAHQRFLLADDDDEKNLKDALDILAKIQESPAAYQSTELFVRGEEEKCAPLLDTALMFIQEAAEQQAAERKAASTESVHVYFIDDAKRMAQQLITVCPLFTALDQTEKTNAAKLHFVIITSNPDQRLAQWLIREAFWAMTTLNEPSSDENSVQPDSCQPRITVLSPHANKLRKIVTDACPGLLAYTRRNGVSVKADLQISLPDYLIPIIDYVQLDPEEPDCSPQTTEKPDCSLWATIDKFEDEDRALYYVADTGNDLTNIQVASRIRDEDIRAACLKNHMASYSKRRAVIAVPCRDPNLAHLARHLAVPKESRKALSWFSSYSLHVFGSIDERYSFDWLDGGIYEKAAQGLHCQYCEKMPGDSNAMISYFSRFYNRDSSLAAVLSLPYRFHTVLSDQYSECLPLENRNFWEPECLKAFRNSFKAFGSTDFDTLSKYEHARWTSYMLSRGWVPASPEQTVSYLTNGADRHNLYLGHIHPCIASWEALMELQKFLNDRQNYISKKAMGTEEFYRIHERFKNADCFTSTDVYIIKKTGELLDWLIGQE